MGKPRKQQQSKGGENKALARAMVGKRSSNAAGFHVPATSYSRKDKHKGRRDW